MENNNELQDKQQEENTEDTTAEKPEIINGEIKQKEEEPLPEEESTEETQKIKTESQAEKAPQQEAEAVEVPAPETKPKRSFLYKLLSPETKMGRFMRPFLRILAAVIGFFALGFLTTYILLYRPTRIAYEQTYSQLNQVVGQLEESQAQLESSQSDYEDLAESSQAEIEDLEENLWLANTRIDFLKFKNNINLARRALVYDDEGASALEALNDAEEDLADLLGELEEIDPVLAGLLNDRLSVVQGELVRDPDQAQLELESLYNTILEFEMELFE